MTECQSVRIKLAAHSTVLDGRKTHCHGCVIQEDESETVSLISLLLDAALFRGRSPIDGVL